MASQPRTKTLCRHVVIRIAAAASVDPRTVAKFCAGDDVRAMGAERIEKALREAGLLEPVKGP